MKRQICPCCLYPTLDHLDSYEICYLCFWEDDGQGEEELEEVWGGPNGDYSLKRARDNFQHHFLMYDEGDETVTQTNEQLKLKKQVIDLFSSLEKITISTDEEHKALQQIEQYKIALDAFVGLDSNN